MELKSDPRQYITIMVTDVYAEYTSGRQSFVLVDGKDDFYEDGDRYRLEFANGDVATLYKTGLHSITCSRRTQRVIAPQVGQGQAAQSATPPAADQPNTP